MKFEIKNKPNLSDQDIYDGEKHGVSFEWLIDKLEDQKAFLMKKNEDVTIETYIFSCVQREKKKKVRIAFSQVFLNVQLSIFILNL